MFVLPLAGVLLAAALLSGTALDFAAAAAARSQSESVVADQRLSPRQNARQVVPAVRGWQSFAVGGSPQPIPAVSPAFCSGHPTGVKHFMHGGAGGQGQAQNTVDDLWSLDLGDADDREISARWTQMNATKGNLTASPEAALTAHCMAFSERRNELLLFGGFRYQDVNQRRFLYSYDVGGAGWRATGTAETAPFAASPRYYTQCHFNLDDVFVIIGGTASNNGPNTADRVAAFVPAQGVWLEVNETGDVPPNIPWGQTSVHTASDELILFGGWYNPPNSYVNFIQRADISLLPEFRWRTVNTRGTPPGIVRLAFSGLTSRNTVLVFGGSNNNPVTTVSEYDVENDGWLALTELTTRPGRHSGASFMDPTRRLLYVWGGARDGAWYNSNVFLGPMDAYFLGYEAYTTGTTGSTGTTGGTTAAGTTAATTAAAAPPPPPASSSTTTTAGAAGADDGTSDASEDSEDVLFIVGVVLIVVAFCLAVAAAFVVGQRLRARTALPALNDSVEMAESNSPKQKYRAGPDSPDNHYQAVTKIDEADSEKSPETPQYVDVRSALGNADDRPETLTNA